MNKRVHLGPKSIQSVDQNQVLSRPDRDYEGSCGRFVRQERMVTLERILECLRGNYPCSVA
jgi:hypothetical protein